ncbi:MAG TPA: FABP family protein [Acidimicrobiales bacterium]|nr:FABP family protein [Acidimicrobiales bacterium]
MSPSMHPDVEPWGALLLGTWRGEGEGHYPTIEPFRYSEEIDFTHVGKPFLAYRQATVKLGTGLPAHAEAGYWRPAGDGRVELVMAHPTGIVEIEEGTVITSGGGVELHLRSTAVACSTTAKSVVTLARDVHVAGDTLRYDLAMGAVGQPHQHHLSATLRRVS